MEDLQIVELYWQRDPQAITQSKEKYGIYCFTVAKHVLANWEDSEECVNDTWLYAWNKMPPHRPSALKFFLAKRLPAVWLLTDLRPILRKREVVDSSLLFWMNWQSVSRTKRMWKIPL